MEKCGRHRPDTPTLKEFILCGNYQLDHRGFVALTKVIPHNVEHWNMSYCDMSEYQTLATLQELNVQCNDATCPPTLTALTLQGAKMCNEDACEALAHLLNMNRSLVRITIDDPKYPLPSLSTSLLAILVEGLQYNYGLTQLQLNLSPLGQQQRTNRRRYTTATSLRQALEEERTVRDTLDFYLELNRAGRKILQDEHHHDRHQMLQAIQKARLSSRRLDVLYWLIRNSLEDWF